MTRSIESHFIRFADLLEKTPGYAPTKHHLPPLWLPEMSSELRGIARVAHVPTLNWGPKNPEDEVPEGTRLVELDANGAFVAAATSSTFAHCGLENTGPLDLRETPMSSMPAGYMLVDAHPWQLGAPGSPLGPGRPRTTAEGRVWVPHTIYAVLRDLVEGASWTKGGHWPDATVHDSWTADTVRFEKWAGVVRDTRAAAKAAGDVNGSERIKVAYSQAVQMWATEPDPKGTPMAKRKKKNYAWRPDWNAALRGQHFANMWRRAYQCTQLGHAPLWIGGTDRVLFAEHHLLALLGANKSPMRLDETGLQLGTFHRTHSWYAGIEDL